MSVVNDTIIDGSSTAPIGSTFADIYQDTRNRLQMSEDDDSLIKGYVNDRYKEIANKREWSWLYEKTTLDTVADYDTGTITVTEGSTTVTGSGTTFTSAMTGRKFKVDGFSEIYTITYVSPTELTLDTEYHGDTESGASYKIYQDIISLPSDLDSIVEIRQHRAPKSLESVGLRELISWDPAAYNENSSAVYTDPTHYAHYVPDSDGYQTILVWPPPYRAISLLLEYKKIVTELINDSDEPLIPEQYRQLLKWGAMADLYGKRDDNRQSYWEAKFEKMLFEFEMKYAQQDDNKQMIFKNPKRYPNASLQTMANKYDLGNNFDRW